MVTMANPDKLTRRGILYTGLVFSAAAASSYFFHDEIKSAFTSGTNNKNKKSRLDDVKLGLMSPEEYVSERIENLDWIIQARNSGRLGDILADPFQGEIANRLERAYSKLGLNNKDSTFGILEELENYYSRIKEGLGTILPASQKFIGKKITLDMVLTPLLFGSDFVKNDYDAESVARHELRHIGDFYDGFIIGMDFQEIIKNKFANSSFIKDVLELRAIFEELKHAANEIIPKGIHSLSPDYFNGIGREYYSNWNSVLHSPRNKIERLVSNIALQELSGIVPNAENGNLYLYFSLAGKNFRTKIEY